jgi:hypothetical protein
VSTQHSALGTRHAAAPPSLPNSSLGAYGQLPRATGCRSSTSHVRARCRRTSSHCPTRAGPCGRTTPRCGCEARRPGHHRLTWAVARRTCTLAAPRLHRATGAGRRPRVIWQRRKPTGSNPGRARATASRLERVAAPRLSLPHTPWSTADQGPRAPIIRSALSTLRRARVAAAGLSIVTRCPH